MKTIIDYTNQVKAYAAAAKSIAPVENGTTASGSYAIGANFMRDGVLYKAKTAIIAGDTLTLNTNYELADPESTQLGQLKEALTDEAETRAKNGAHNLLPYDLPTIKSANTAGTWSGDTYTYQGISVSFNADGTCTATGLEENEYKALGNVFIKYCPNYPYKAGNIIRGCPAGGNVNTYSVLLTNAAATQLLAYDAGTGGSYNEDVNDSLISIRFMQNTVVENLTFKPMVTLATDADNKWTPYAMTNKELTDVAQEVKGNYVVSERRSVSVNADGTKSYKTLLNELATAFLTTIQGIGTDDYVLPIGMLISNYAELTPEGRAAFVESTKTASSYYGAFRAFDLTSSYYIMHELNIDTTLNSNTLYLYNQGNNTWTNNTDTVPASGNVITIYYKLYKKIS